MLEENKGAFDSFRTLHLEYSIDQQNLQEKFNEEGAKILEIVRDYENKLCANQERGMYNKFSTGLAEKFQAEVRKIFPLIDHVGIKINKESAFILKKISL